EGGTDSDVKIVPDDANLGPMTVNELAPRSPEDSDIRISPLAEGGVVGEKEVPKTEEIDLDAEIRMEDEATPTKPASSKSKLQRAAAPWPPPSPSDLSEDDLAAPAAPAPAPAAPAAEYSPTRKEKVPPPVPAKDEEAVELGELAPSGLSAGDSGINLAAVSDS